MVRRVCVALVMTVILSVEAMPAFAQSTRKIGVVMGFPAAAGVIWHVGDSIALRPDVSVSRQRTETTSTAVIGTTPQTFTSSNESWNTGLGLSALFYLGQPDDLRFYVTPRVAWLWTRSTAETSSGISGLTPRDADGDGYLVSGAFGAQYAPADRFRVFGELGLSYSNQDEEADLLGSSFKTSITGFGLRSGVGVVIYF